VIERARGGDVAPVRLESFGLSKREQEVAGLLLRSLSSREIAKQLVVYPYTVEDHIRSICEKAGVRGRRELVGLVFVADHLPQLVSSAPVDSNGQFVADQ
jgi:DNA-binding CsgD family transcriptional regulator